MATPMRYCKTLLSRREYCCLRFSPKERMMSRRYSYAWDISTSIIFP